MTHHLNEYIVLYSFTQASYSYFNYLKTTEIVFIFHNFLSKRSMYFKVDYVYQSYDGKKWMVLPWDS